MYVSNSEIRFKQLTALKMRVELIAWRVQEVGMSPWIRAAIPEAALSVFENLLFENAAPDEERLRTYELAVTRVEEELARDSGFWRTGRETLH